MEPYKKQKLTTPEDFPAMFVNAWNNRDTYELIELFDESAELENVKGLWQHKNKEFFSAYENGLKFNFKEVRLSVLSTKIKFVTKSIAELKVNMQVSPSAKSNIVAHKIVLSFVLQHSEDDWLCIALTVEESK
ncbi:hypothetical protein GCM10011506_42350 [Marivirga lumbricoides]|uniref:DUF4440 domain-containing protein n=2 Tax=Marivirga lumbricoides TaxID=1046115 RepID=A0ABQ1N665_9BACT|nr:hypothetical protein GCM10011506_42350 [Marivirga lumbricoides]